MGLVYTSLRSVVALLSLSITVLKALGGCNQIQPILLNLRFPDPSLNPTGTFSVS